MELRFQSAEEFFESAGRAPGQGPFHVRGTAYLYHQQWVRRFLPGGLAAQKEALGRFGADPFFDTVFLASGMYDVFPLVAMGCACAAVRGENAEEFVRMRARYQAEQDIQNIRKWVVKLASPEAVAARFPGVAQSYFDFGVADGDIEPGRLDMVFRGIPLLIADWIVWTSVGFAVYALEVNGAQNIRVEPTRAQPQNKMFRSYPMGNVRALFRWDAKRK